MPPWMDIFTNEQLKKLGFKKIDDKSKGGGVIFAVAEGSPYAHIYLEYRSKDKAQLYVNMTPEEGPPWLVLPIEPSVKTVEEIVKTYLEPAKKSEMVFGGVSYPARVLALQQSQGRIDLSDNPKTLSWFIGTGDYGEDMVNLENGMTFNPWLTPEAVRQATGNQGRWSQWFTAHSSSLLTIERISAFGMAVFVLEFQYHPVKHEEFIRKLQANQLKGTPYAQLPADIPLDGLGALYIAGFTTMKSPADLMAEIKDKAAADNVFFLDFLVNDKDTEKIYLPLATHPSEKVRDGVASVAAGRGNMKVLEAAKAAGISSTMQHDIEVYLKENKSKG